MSFLRLGVLSTSFALLVSLIASDTWADTQPSGSISAAKLSAVLAAHFEAKEDFEQDDLIQRTDAEEILATLKELGWEVSDAQEILGLLLPADHIIPRTFATPQGTRFMRKVDGYQLIYDRLHRTAELPGGKALVRDIVKLPNGEIYAKMKPRPGNPNFTDLLPKGRNGHTPPPTDFDKPTGYIYTLEQLAQRLEESRQRDFPPSTATK